MGTVRKYGFTSVLAAHHRLEFSPAFKGSWAARISSSAALR
jgi:hypothetical protein